MPSSSSDSIRAYSASAALSVGAKMSRAKTRRCDTPARVTYLLKQVGSASIENSRPINLSAGHGGDWDEWPADMSVREMPPL